MCQGNSLFAKTTDLQSSGGASHSNSNLSGATGGKAGSGGVAVAATGRGDLMFSQSRQFSPNAKRKSGSSR